MKNTYYGSLCTQFYDLDKPKAPPNELAFYLSFANQGDKILEPLCGSGRFLVPFAQRRYDIQGFDMSEDMLGACRRKLANQNLRATIWQSTIEDFTSSEKYDYIFISSGSFCLFTDDSVIHAALSKIRMSLKEGGRFVFAVDTDINHISVGGADVYDTQEYMEWKRVYAPNGDMILLKGKSTYNRATKTEYSPGIYELYHNNELLETEHEDFYLKLYSPGELEPILRKHGFVTVVCYSDYEKTNPIDLKSQELIYCCQ